MYTSVKDMLWHAHENHYTVMAISMINMEQVKACIESAEEEASTVVLNISPRQMEAHTYPYIATPMIKNLAETIRVPVALSIDHGTSIEDIETTVRCGYSSMMVDASSYKLEENIRRVRAVAALAHDRDISMGVELGHVGAAANAGDQNGDYYTDMAQAEGFVKQTGCDCLAVAVGTAYGSYPKNMIPKLDFEQLRGSKEKLNMPLVLHSRSGTGEENIKKTVLYGINKISVCMDFMDDTEAGMLKVLEEQPDIQYVGANKALEESMRRFIEHFMRMINSSG